MNLPTLHKRALLIGGAALLLASLPGEATSVTILNSDFSSPPLSTDTDSPTGYNQTAVTGDSTTVADWTTGTTSNGTFDQSWGLINNVAYDQYPSGLPNSATQFAYENVYAGTGDPSVTGSLTQALSTDFISGDSYTLSVYVGHNPSATSPTSAYDGTYLLELFDLADSASVPVASNSVASSTITAGDFDDLSLNYTPADDGQIEIALLFTSGGENLNEQGNFGDVAMKYTPAVPEPSSYALLGFGLGMAALLVRLRQRRA